MERERLTRLLEDPSRSTREDATDLRAMAEQYPWFTGAQLLRAAGDRAQGNVLADETLRAAAAHLPSRAVLHDLVERASAPAPLRVVKQVPPPLPEAKPSETIPAVQPIAPVPLPVTVEGSAPHVILPEQDVFPQHLIEEPQPGPVELEDGPAQMLNAPEKRSDEPLPAAPAADELDRQITEAAVASAFDLTYLEGLRASVPTGEPPADEQLPASAQQAPAKSTSLNSRLRFTEWLDAASNDAVASAAPLPAPDRIERNEAMAPAPAPGTLAPSALIDRFIQQQPPEIPPKPAFFTPQQAAKKSLDDTAGLVTETLARIYEQQGNLPKAIEAYRRLALKYPDKSTYFAALSKALEEKQTP